MNEIYTFNKRTWIQLIAACLLVFAYTVAQAQQASQGNATVFSGGQITLLGSHSFIAGGTGAQIGIVKTDRTGANGIGIVNFGKDATHTGANNANHIDGYVGKYGTAAFNFPIGNGVKIRPAGISAINPNNPATAVFKAAYWFSNSASYPTANMGTGVSKVSNLEYWDVDGASAIELTLTWDAASSLSTLTANAINNLIVVGYNLTTQKWESLGRAGGTTGTLANTGTITARGVTPDTYAAFTFGSAVVTIPDLRPLITMAQRNFVKSTAMSRPITIRVANVGETGSTAGGVANVYLSVGMNFTAAVNGNSSWTLTEEGGGEYTITSNISIPRTTPASTSDIPLILTAKPTVTKGNYNISVIIEDNSSGEINNSNNGISSDVSVAVN